MDPLACLEEAIQACHRCDWETVFDRLLDYARWRRSGGFEPTVTLDGQATRGDVAADQLRERVKRC